MSATAFWPPSSHRTILFIESHVGTLPPWEGRILYRSQIDPHLTWACEVTGVGTVQQLNCLSDVQHYFLRRLLGLQSRSQLCILFSELDTWPVKARRFELQLRYLRHLLLLPREHFAHLALNEALKTAQDLLRCRRVFWSSVSRVVPKEMIMTLATLRALDPEDLFHALLGNLTTAEPLALLCSQMLDIYARADRYIPSREEVTASAANED